MSSEEFELKSFGELVEGDVISGALGQPVTVVKAYDEHIPESMFEIEFDNGKKIEASDNHLWYVVSSIDRALHKKRVRDGRRLFKNLDEDSLNALLEMSGYERNVEVSLIDMITVMRAEGDAARTAAVVRVANSIGHIAEEHTEYQDLYGGNMVDAFSLRLYDAKLFAEQLLSLSSRKYAKKYPLIVGKVVTTEDLTMILEMDVEIPEINIVER